MDILRGKRLKPLAHDAISFASSVIDDKALTKAVVKINMAHMVMLMEKEIVSGKQGAACLRGLLSVPEDLKLDPALEDIHMNVEAAVTAHAGQEAGGQLNLGKSRNDQVATAIRIVLREHVLKAIEELLETRSVLLEKSRKAVNTLMPGYTHLQHAQPITLAHYLVAHHDALTRDTERLIGAFQRVNLSPMGAAALATSTVGVDRPMVSSLLGFGGLVEDSVDAVSSRDFAVEILSVFAIVMTNVSRLAEELVLWSTDEFKMLEMPDAYSSTSSIMPQKKNPVVAELLRAKTSTVYGCLMSALSLLKALPYSYNMDLQQLTPRIWEACDVTLSSLSILPGLLRGVKFDQKRLRELVERDSSLATDVAELLATKHSVPFRTAHRVVGELASIAIMKNTPFEKVVLQELNTVLAKATHKTVRIPEKELKVTLNPEESVKKRSAEGGPSPDIVSRMIRARLVMLDKHRKALKEYEDTVRKGEILLLSKVSRLKGGENQ